jgi:membrane-associated phospholipid phosphatase
LRRTLRTARTFEGQFSRVFAAPSQHAMLLWACFWLFCFAVCAR